jgi:glycosyltransferase involved in cell wall biosynthesis
MDARPRPTGTPPSARSGPPLVSVGIPLYGSSRFLDVIIANIEGIEYPNLEVLISDRHLLDDAIGVLRARYGADTRFRFLEGRDELDWVGNFNLLLRSAQGRYFVWMAHDDSFPPNYVGDLVAALEARPDAVLAFGEVEQVSLDGFLPTFPFVPPPVSPDEPWTLGSSLRVLTLWQLWIPFRGVFRRDVVEAAGLYIRPTRRNIRADMYWVFALSLMGRLCFVPSCRCTKRFYRTSTGADWRFDLRQSLDAVRVLRSYLRDHSRSRRESLAGQAVVSAWCVVQGVLPAGLARRLGIAVRSALLARRGRAARKPAARDER